MPNNWGGKRPGAGRPRGKSRTRAHLLTRSIKTKEWLQLIQHLKDIALSSDPGSLRALALLFRYQFGDGLDSVERLLDREAVEAEFERRSQARKEDKDEEDESEPERKPWTFEDSIVDSLSGPGARRVFWDSSIGKLCITRAKDDSELDKNQEHSSPDLPMDSLGWQK